MEVGVTKLGKRPIVRGTKGITGGRIGNFSAGRPKLGGVKPISKLKSRGFDNPVQNQGLDKRTKIK